MFRHSNVGLLGVPYSGIPRPSDQSSKMKLSQPTTKCQTQPVLSCIGKAKRWKTFVQVSALPVILCTK